MSVVINGTTGITTPDVTTDDLSVDTNTLFVDPANNRVGIGTSSPTARLHVQDTEANVRIQGSSGTYSLGVASSGGRFYLFDNVASAERLTVTSAGNLQFNSGYGSSATAYGCRAWVNFNGTGTVAIRASGNVSSITDNGTGNYTVNFTTAMPDANYAVNVTGQVTFGSFYGMGAVNGAIAPTTTAVSVLSLNNVGGAALSDATYMNVSIFR